MQVSLPHITGHHLERRGVGLTGLLLPAAALQVAAGAGLAYVAGFSAVRAALDHFDWVWTPALAGSLGVSFAGYCHACKGIFTVAGGPRLSGAQMRMVVTAGFGGFLARGGRRTGTARRALAGGPSRHV
jgi:hypothetical protein